MESKKNKKSPKKGRKKALSPSKQIAPFKLSLEKNSPKPNINIESNDKNDNNNKPKSPNKEKVPEKVEEKNDIKKNLMKVFHLILSKMKTYHIYI